MHALLSKEILTHAHTHTHTRARPRACPPQPIYFTFAWRHEPIQKRQHHVLKPKNAIIMETRKQAPLLLQKIHRMRGTGGQFNSSLIHQARWKAQDDMFEQLCRVVPERSLPPCCRRFLWICCASTPICPIHATVFNVGCNTNKLWRGAVV